MRFGCPVKCKYCLITNVEARRKEWAIKHRWGINKTVLFINRLPQDIPIADMNIDPRYFKAEYVGFQGITDAFWNIFNSDLRYMVEQSYKAGMKKLVLVTKQKISTEQYRIISSSDRVQLVVSITGLDMIEGTNTKDRLNNIENAMKYGIPVLPIIHPYIHGLSNLSFLSDLAAMGIKEMSAKGFRYNEEHMGSWAREIIPPESLNEYRKHIDEEYFIGEKDVMDKISSFGMKPVEFREYIHRPNGVPGISRDLASQIVSEIFPRCVVSSSDPDNVYMYAIKRRL